MGKDTLWKNRPFGWLLSSLGGFPVTRGTADREALRRCVAVLEAGEPLVLFPEGERKSGPTVQPLFDGAVYVALRAGVPIVPVGIGGSERVMPKGARFVHPHKVHVIVGAPIESPPPADSGRVPRSTIRRHSDELHATLQQLFDDAQQRVGLLEASAARGSAPVGGEGGDEVGRVGGAAQLAGRVHRQLRARRRRRWRSRAGSP